MLNVSKYGFTPEFCIGVYFDDLATMTGKYFTHTKETVIECRSVYYLVHGNFLSLKKSIQVNCALRAGKI